MTLHKSSRQANELRAAISQDDIAKAEAWAAGVDATMPLTRERLDELCALGERMMRTKLRRETALVEMNEWLLLQPEAPARDFSLRHLRQLVRNHIREFSSARH